MQVNHRGVTPAGKSQLVFQERLRSFADMDHLNVVSRFIQMNDEVRVPLHSCPSVSWLTEQNAIPFQMRTGPDQSVLGVPSLVI